MARKKVSARYVVFIKGKNTKKYYYQTIGGRKVWDSLLPISGYALTTARKLASKEGRDALRQLPPGWGVYVAKKPKRG